MAQLTVADAWVERVNKNLLPLLNKFSIRRQGPFGLSNLIQPVVNVETLEEELAAAQQLVTAAGTLTNTGDEVIITVPTGQIWNIEYVLAQLAAPPATGCTNHLMVHPAGTGTPFFGLVTRRPTGLVVDAETMTFMAGNTPLTLGAPGTIVVRRRTTSAQAQAMNLAVFFRVV